jgi:hypothetical protein
VRQRALGEIFYFWGNFWFITAYNCVLSFFEPGKFSKKFPRRRKLDRSYGRHIVIHRYGNSMNTYQIASNEYCRRITFLFFFVLIISKLQKKKVKKSLFSGLFVNEQNVLSKIRKNIVQVHSRYFHFAFQRVFSDFLFFRS